MRTPISPVRPVIQERVSSELSFRSARMAERNSLMPSAEIKYLTWTGDNLLRQVVYEGLREDKPAAEVRREVPNAKPGTPAGSR